MVYSLTGPLNLLSSEPVTVGADLNTQPAVVSIGNGFLDTRIQKWLASEKDDLGRAVLLGEVIDDGHEVIEGQTLEGSFSFSPWKQCLHEKLHW